MVIKPPQLYFWGFSEGKGIEPMTVYNATPKIFDIIIDTSNILPLSNTIIFCSNHTINSRNKIINALDFLVSEQFKNTDS